MTILNNIKAKIYNQLVDTGFDKLTRDEFGDWFNQESNDQRVSIDSLCSSYSEAYDKAHQNRNVYPRFLPYPFKSARKRQRFRQSLKNDHFRPLDIKMMVPANTRPSDLKIKPLKKKFSRKTFSPYPGSWEIDHIEHTHGRNTYLLGTSTLILFIQSH